MDDKPNPPAKRNYREITLASIIFGIIIGAMLNAAITYAGLIIGFTIVGSSVCAVLGFGVLRGVLRKGTITEVNIAQTIGSAVNTPNSGVIFTVPVLFLLGIPLINPDADTFMGLPIPNTNFWLITLACVTGAILGGAFIVPLRKQMLDIERLRFPSATAVGAILKSPGAGAKKSIVLVIGIVLSALIALPAQLPALTRNASVDELDTLLANEKITIQDVHLTRAIDSWIETESAPDSLIQHGQLIQEMRTKRAELKTLKGTPQHDDLLAEIQQLETSVATAQASAISEIQSQTVTGVHAVTAYQADLALRAYQATLPDGDANHRAWSSLRSPKTGWAQKPLFGYSDLDVRLPATADATGETVDFAYNGTGTDDPVLDISVDRDRNGKPDLLVTDTGIDAGRIAGLPDTIQLIFAIAPFALGAGYLTGRAGLFVLAGGILAYVVLNPILYTMGWMPESILPHQAPGYGYGSINRPLGIGLLLGGALMGIIVSLPAIRGALKSIAAAGKVKGGSDELGLKVLFVAVIGAVIFLFLASQFAINKPINLTDPVTANAFEVASETLENNGYTIGFESTDSLNTWNDDWTDDQRADYLTSLNADKPGLLASLPPVARAIIIALIGALWIWFAGIIIAQCTGMTDWSPISGMALITVVLIMTLAGVGAEISAIMIGAALCVAITCAADMMADLKSGYIIGAVPKKQQMVELIFTGIGPVITMGVLLIIAASNMQRFGIPMGAGTNTTAPQAQALQAVITGVQGGAMPYALYGLGAGLGLLLGVGSFAGLGVLVGLSMYLPMQYIATYGVGCVINMIVAKIKGPKWAEEWGVPLAAGFIVGDALLGLSVNMLVLVLNA
ncbi:MAG: OPT/YSL family transporter [Phycisphaerales bacterium JB043]